MEDIFLNADIRLVQEPMPKTAKTDIELFEQICSDALKNSVNTKHTPKPLNMAKAMLSDIKKSLSEFYITKKPINRKERRERAREIKAKILRFRGYCRKHKIRIENPPK